MKRAINFLFVFVLTLTANLVFAQNRDFDFYQRNGVNNVAKSSVYTDIEGSPFLFNVFAPGKAVTKGGKVYDNIKLNYDVYSNVLLFVYDNADTAKMFKEDIKTFTVFLPVVINFSKGYPAIDKQTPESFYEVLTNKGKTALLKSHYVAVNVIKNYDNTQTKKFQSLANYYIFKDQQMYKISKSKDAVLSVLADKKDALQAYLKSTSINFKKDEDLAKLFDYYNTL